MSAAIQPVGEPKVIYGRDAYIPAWSPAWRDEDLGMEVKQDGKLLGFTLREMLPERRWAVQMDGNLMEQRDFEPLYVQFVSMSVQGGHLVSISKANGYFDPKLVPIPRVERFVSETYDYSGRAVRIGFDPNAAPDPTEKPVVLHDHRGNDVNPNGPNELKLARLTVLADLKAKGLISSEALASEMASTLLEPQEIVAPPPPVGFDAVKEAAPEEATVHTAPCGFQARSAAGVAAHSRHCDDCQTTPETVKVTE